MFSQSIHFSNGLDIMLGYEELFVATMVARGFAVVVTDYDGLGTPGMHTYVNRLAEAHAVLDAARAAKQLPGTSLEPNGPVALWGYSLGGGSSPCCPPSRRCLPGMDRRCCPFLDRLPGTQSRCQQGLFA